MQWLPAWIRKGHSPKSYVVGGKAKERIHSAIFRHRFPYGGPSFSPGVWCWSLTTPDGRVQCHGFFYLSLSPERGANRCAIARQCTDKSSCRSCDIIWGQWWRISQSLLPLVIPSLIRTQPLVGSRTSQLINCLQIALLTWQIKHLQWWGCLDK